MASIWKSHIVCDGCGAVHEPHPLDTTAQLRRRAATIDGWSCSDRGDYCPRCADAISHVEPEPAGDYFDGDIYFKSNWTI